MKLFNYLLIVFVALFGAINLTAQTPFLNFTGNANDEGFGQMKYIDNGITKGYYTIGYEQTPGNNNSRVATLTHLNESGDIQWTRTYGQATSFNSLAYNQQTQELMLCGYRGVTGPTRQIMLSLIHI